MQRRIFRGEIAAAVVLAIAPPAAAFLAAALQPALPLQLPASRLLLVMLFELAAIGLAGSALRRRPVDSGNRFHPVSPPPVLAGLALFAAWVILYFGAALVLTNLFPALPSVRPFRMLVTAPPVVVVLFAVVHAVFEEVVVVGYAVSALAADGAALSIGASTILRCVCHLHQGPLAAVSVIPVGLIFAAVYWRSRRVGPLAVAHGLGSILAFALAGAASL
jgi:membrane protease YdiL (CAAX protease family)